MRLTVWSEVHEVCALVWSVTSPSVHILNFFFPPESLFPLQRRYKLAVIQNAGQFYADKHTLSTSHTHTHTHTHTPTGQKLDNTKKYKKNAESK